MSQKQRRLGRRQKGTHSMVDHVCARQLRPTARNTIAKATGPLEQVQIENTALSSVFAIIPNPNDNYRHDSAATIISRTRVALHARALWVSKNSCFAPPKKPFVQERFVFVARPCRLLLTRTRVCGVHTLNVATGACTRPQLRAPGLVSSAKHCPRVRMLLYRVMCSL